jgi:hypothetical protein
LRAFVHEDGTAAPIEVPGSRSTTAFGINNRGQIVGSCASNAQHGFDFKEDGKQPLKTIDVPFPTDAFFPRPTISITAGRLLGNISIMLSAINSTGFSVIEEPSARLMCPMR